VKLLIGCNIKKPSLELKNGEKVLIGFNELFDLRPEIEKRSDVSMVR
jgi:hypothetical protein